MMTCSPGNTAAVIVSFNDPAHVRRCLNTVQNQVAHVYVVDNSTISELCFSGSNSAVLSVLRNPVNLGLGVALNQGISASRGAGFDWTLLLDQDSQVGLTMIEEMGRALKQLEPIQQKQVALITPSIFDANTDDYLPAIITGLLWNKKIYPRDKQQFIDFRITSGSVLRNSVVDEIGLMDEQFFIDYIDYDYCFRLRQAGYFILLAHQARLQHALGEARNTIFGMPIIEHSSMRVYYQTRNRLEIIRRYGSSHPSVVLSELTRMLLKTVKIVLFEKGKVEKLRNYFVGIRDFLFGCKDRLSKSDYV